MDFIKLSVAVAVGFAASFMSLQASHEEIPDLERLSLCHKAPKMNVDVIRLPSENFSKTSEGDAIKIVPRAVSVSCMGTELYDSLRRLTKSKENGGDGVSTHFFIPQLTGAQIMESDPDLVEGQVLHYPDQVPVFQLVDETHRAWHAGPSKWRNLNTLEGCATSINSCTLGVHFHTPGYANGDGSDWFKFTPFTPAQISTGGAFLKGLIDRHTIDGRNIVAYADIQEGRTAPGPLFPWAHLATDFGVGYYPTPFDLRPSIEGDVNAYVEKALKDIGYYFESEKLGVYVNKYRMRFMGETWNGVNQEIDDAFLCSLIPVVTIYSMK
ncbi:MAG: N-acetylmuramoyl-L-alanine amidase [Alphaproteobacteria bacterium]|nr:N-acetylmuramoyl-L-alanine amidase [Alphaproteobacteria bacterium]